MMYTKVLSALVFTLTSVSASEFSNWRNIPGSLTQIHIDDEAKIACGVNSIDDIYCAPVSTYGWYQLPGKLIQVT